MQNNTESNLNDLHQASENNPELKKDLSVNEEWQKSHAAENKLNTEFEALKSKYNELEDQHKRLWADQQNMINRFNREKQELYKYAAVTTLEQILPALDNFDFAKKSLNENTEFNEIIKSISMLQEQLLLSLKSVGLEEVDTNCSFNPELHEAVSSVPDPQKEDGTILEVLKKGFKVKDKVLRVATVVVSSKG
jgi:molecular chaperone GrpE